MAPRWRATWGPPPHHAWWYTPAFIIRAVTAYLSIDEVTQFTYIAEACGFRGSGGLALALIRHFLADYPMPKVKPPKRKRG